MKMTQEEIDKLINENKRFQIVLKGYDLTGVNLAGANLINADLPDGENCRAKNHDNNWSSGELVDCLIEHPLCKFSLNFGGLLLCQHPRRKEIVERTQAMLSNSSSQSE